MSTPFHQRYVQRGMRGGDFLPLGVEAAAERVREVSARGTPLVVTGQQVGLFLGPLYTLAKAATVIAWARQLGCQPLFWLQTEDHDFAEIDHCFLPTARLSIAGSPARISVAHRTLGADIETVLAQTAELIAAKPFAAETMDLLRRHYQPGMALADAFAGVLQELYPELRIFQPRTVENARLAAPIIARALAQAPRIDALLKERTRALEAAGHAEQIHVREGTPLPFLHEPDALGERRRIGRTEVPEAQRLLTKQPERFSTSALLRPIVQDRLLPVALYVGGPAEVDYFAQAACLYPVFDLPPPIVALRNRIRLIPARVAALLQTLGLTPNDVADETLLAQKLRSDHKGPTLAWSRELEDKLAALGGKDADKARRSIHHAMVRLERRHARALALRDETVRARMHKLRAWLYPNGAPQERTLAFVAFAAQVGPRALAQRILSEIQPLHTEPRDIYL